MSVFTNKIFMKHRKLSEENATAVFLIASILVFRWTCQPIKEHERKKNGSNDATKVVEDFVNTNKK